MSLMMTMILMEQYGPRLSMDQLAKVLGLATATLHARMVGRHQVNNFPTNGTCISRQSVYSIGHGQHGAVHTSRR
jgi:hypothetical protein